ncbi:E3 ubiquitin-protein ligase RGLG2-like [Gigantopelta aegis]|uniref:E3 ubiquitin-protein ligase RGLG2-like n=1 Tax=Gigantopelta aegis TaxID=1735272 RepID=UPI001B88E047|nr:E3 ubiquitin-protein ligase RGLG2-like [Gigantopelta aegis]XP_041350500.1 E3 ubiquitin-protein ligase RGLG2-like [Gigantopelta aegis]XP_041350501.1 E3 ubiquitin-protein ligase RGLG2-like [Gigantopelta aegis]XP_041350502.1 E3 ubiquitin-protein ligase RGLG2-like [Gigantopelta aegis]
MSVQQMSMWSCFLYVIANIIGLVLHWLYYQEKSQSTSNSSTDIAEMKKVMQYKPTPSLLAMLGLQAHHTFFAFEDHFNTFEEVSLACRKAGLEKCGLIIGVDFSASNEWQGRKTFSSQNLHRIIPGRIYNPYQKVISIIGKTLEPFDDDNLIPAFGFGDRSTLGMDVFSFVSSGEMCCGFSEVLDRYSDIATRVELGGPTNFVPVIYKAIDIVKESSKYHILIIIADRQVNEEQTTIAAIVEASNHPLSIILVGVGDGPWDVMEDFDNCLPQREFDNFQFVNFHAVTAKARNPETAFALHALMEIPDQYKTIKALGYITQTNEGNGNCVQSLEAEQLEHKAC